MYYCVRVVVFSVNTGIAKFFPLKSRQALYNLCVGFTAS